VYVTFGTLFNTDVGLLRAVVAGVRDLPVRVVVTVGPSGDPAALGDQPPNVHVARYVPQERILPACAAVVSHGGSGTVLAGLARGLPQLCIPQGADQFDNAAAVAASGAGLALGPGEVTAPAVREAVERLLGEPAHRAAARRVAEEIARMPDAAEVAGLLAARFS
jgi:MGT family glycosyltransferase